MSYKNIIFEKHDGIGRIILNRPERLNALTRDMVNELRDAVLSVERDPEVKVLILKGAGRAFCSGHDIRQGPPEKEESYFTDEPFFRARPSHHAQMRNEFEFLWEIPQPTIAQVHGWCIVMGLFIAMHCDLVFAAEDAQFLYRPVGGGGLLYSLWPWLIGMRKSKELFFVERAVSGKEAAEMGMINRAIPADKLEEEVEAFAKRVTELPVEYHALSKWATNKAFQAMGMRLAQDYGADLHSVAHIVASSVETRRVLREQGLRDYVQRRNAPSRGES